MFLYIRNYDGPDLQRSLVHPYAKPDQRYAGTSKKNRGKKFSSIN